jgi:hypothetical protein
MAGDLKATQCEQGHQVAHMERISSGIEAAIESHGSLRQALCQGIQVSAVRIEPAPLQFFENRHWSSAVNGRAQFLGKTIVAQV